MPMTIDEQYYKWLVGFVGGEYDLQIYQRALSALYSTEFEFSITGDHNRVADGFDLRNKFCREIGVRPDDLSNYIPDYCTVLEVMAALAYRIEYDIMHDDDIGDRTNLWFWAMFDNLGLSNYDDYHFDIFEVRQIIRRFVKRQYERNGVGSMFPIHGKCPDMRREELWYQANYWLEENY